MALVTCKECGAQVSNSAKACPACGAPPPKRTSTFTWIVAGFLVFMIGRVALDGSADPPASPTVRASTAAPVPAKPIPPPPPDPKYLNELARIEKLTPEDFCLKELRKLRRTKGAPPQPWFDALAKAARAFDVAGNHLVNIQAGTVEIGMNRCGAMASWGNPERVNKSTYSFGTREQWAYGNRQYLYFQNETLTSFQTN